MSFATAYPECVRRMVLESAHPGLTDFAARRKRLQQDHVLADRLRKESFEEFVHDWYTFPIFSSLHDKPAILDPMKARRLRQNPRSMAHMVQCMSPGRQPDCHPFLNETSLPILAIQGSLDTKYVELARQIENPAYRPVVIDDAGHTVHAEQPETYAAHLIEFLLGSDE